MSEREEQQSCLREENTNHVRESRTCLREENNNHI